MKKNNKKTKNTINKPDNIVNENKKENNESLDKNNIYGKHIMNTSKDENITAKNNVDGLLFHFSLPTGQRIVDIMEYEGITRENVNLKNKISMLEEDKKDLSSRISIMSTNERILKETEEKLQEIIKNKDMTIDELKKENNESLDKNNIYGKHIMNTSKDENITAKNNVDGLLFHFSLPTGQRIVDIMEYEGITRENVNLKNKISMLEEDKRFIQQNIHNVEK